MPWQTPAMASGSGSDARTLVDVTLIDEMLALTPTERLRQNDRTIRLIESIRRGLATDRPEQPPR